MDFKEVKEKLNVDDVVRIVGELGGELSFFRKKTRKIVVF